MSSLLSQEDTLDDVMKSRTLRFLSTVTLNKTDPSTCGRFLIYGW